MLINNSCLISSLFFLRRTILVLVPIILLIWFWIPSISLSTLILEGGDGWQSFTPEKIKVRAINEGFLKECCDKCGFSERRVLDYKVPLLLNFRSGNKADYRLENLQLLCYNCYFLFVGNVFTDGQLQDIESNREAKEKSFDWQLDDKQIENMKSLGLWDEEADEDSLIARL